MPQIEEKYLQQLREAGLHISQPIAAWGYGNWVCKPISTPGNSIPGYEGGYITIGDEPACPDIDAPVIVFYIRNGRWIVRSQEHIPTPGPGDFENEWLTPKEAIKDILDFYFGNPERMEKKAERKAAHQRRRESQ